MHRESSILIAAIPAVVGGGVGSSTTSWFRGVSSAKPASSASSTAADLDELSNRVDTLEGQVARLGQQRWVAIPTPVPAAATATDSPAPSAAKPVDDPVFEAAVRDVLDRVERDKTSDRESRRVERQTQQTQRWLDGFAKQTSLTDDQKAKALAIAQEYLQNLRLAGESDAGALSREERNERRNAVRAESEKQLGQVLSSQQMQAYKESDGLRLDAITRGGGRNRTAQ